MADNLRKLVSNDFLRAMFENLERWQREYNSNSCDENLSYCLEFIEQIAKMQGQLFGILTTTAQEGGRYDGVEVIKSRLLPWLEASFTAASNGKPIDSKVPSLQDTFERDRLRETASREREMKQSEMELSSTYNQSNQNQDDLADSPKSFEATKNRSSLSLLAAEEEINQLKKQLKSLQSSQDDSRYRSSGVKISSHKSIDRASERGLERVSERSLEPRGLDMRSSELRRSDYRSSEKRSGLDKRVSGLRERCDPDVISDYEKQVRTLKDEIAALTAEKSALQGSAAPPSLSRSRSRILSPSRSRSQSRGASRRGSDSRRDSGSDSRRGSGSDSRQGSRSRSHSHSRSRSRSGSPCNTMVKIRTPSPNRAKLSSAARKAALLSRFSDAYSQARLDAQCLLRQCIDNAETVQRILYIATVEAFHVAKMAFRHFKIRVRKSLTPSYMGANDFEDAVTDYIICHLDLYDSQSSVNDVIRAMNVNPKISFPPEVDFCLLSNFIQEICCIAFAMQTLDPPLDIAFGADGEMFNECKYRRSYDSDFTAPLVFYHVWPALMENDIVIMKGEAVTKRGAFWNSVRPITRSRSRSLSPICPRNHIGISLITRSRSPSPIRCAMPRY